MRVVLHKLEADSADYLGIKSRVENDPGIFDLSASYCAEKVSLLDVMEADSSFLRNSFLSVIIDGKTSPADIEDFIGTSLQQGLDSLQGRISKPFPVFSGKFLPCPVAVPDILCNLTLHNRSSFSGILASYYLSI
jgi:hypothetical protein